MEDDKEYVMSRNWLKDVGFTKNVDELDILEKGKLFKQCLEMAFPGTSFIIGRCSPLAIFHDNKDLIEDDYLLTVFIELWITIFGNEELIEEFIAYDFAGNLFKNMHK